MIKSGIIILMVFLMASCTTRIIKKERSVELRDVEIENKEPGLEIKIDLTNPDAWEKDVTVWEGKIWDSTLVKLEVPKKFVYVPKTKNIRINKNTSVDVKVTATMDSGKINLNYGVTKVAYQESTIVELTETDTSPTYTRWIIAIAILAFISIIVVVIIRR